VLGGRGITKTEPKRAERVLSSWLRGLIYHYWRLGIIVELEVEQQNPERDSHGLD